MPTVRARREPSETEFVLNIVITPGTFRFLSIFTRSLLAHSRVGIRLVANGCPPGDLDLMREFAGAGAPRVEVSACAGAGMIPHGAALDETYASHDDGEYFCFLDSDVLAKQPFMAAFAALLTQFDVVTSCNVAWSDDTVLPDDARALVGRHAVGHDGFAYGTSYLAIYRRIAVAQVRDRWGVTFSTYAHDQLPLPAQQRLEAMGRQFALYDTAKALNILLQGEGFTLTHVDNPALVHLGGISQYLSDPSVLGRSPTSSTADGPVPWFAASATGRERWDFAHWVAALLRSLVEGGPAPELPAEGDARSRAASVQRELVALAGH
jgi:hypothetical protein